MGRWAARCVALAMAGAGSSAAWADTIVVDNVSSRVYRGGALDVPGESVFEQDFGGPFLFQSDAGSFGATWTTLFSAGDGGGGGGGGVGSWGLTVTVPLTVSASVSPEQPVGLAQAFAGVARVEFSLAITGLPRIYTGDWRLVNIEGEGDFSDGDVIPAGEYHFWVLNLPPFPTDVEVFAGPGQSLTSSHDRVFGFTMTVIPGPGVGVGVGFGLAMMAGMRRRR